VKAAVRELLLAGCKLHNRHECQPPRSESRPPIFGEQSSEPQGYCQLAVPLGLVESVSSRIADVPELSFTSSGKNAHVLFSCLGK